MNIPRGIRLRQLDAFLAVAEEGTISGAARLRNVSQPALSKTISDLERHLGTTLFERVGRRTVLTPAGEVFRRHAIEAMRSLEAACMGALGGGRDRQINVGVLPTVSSGFFPQVAREFSQVRPDVRLSVIAGPNRYLIDQLRMGEIDLVVGRMPPTREMQGLSFEFLYEEAVVLVGRGEHPLGDLPAKEVLRHCPLIMPPKGAIIRQVVEDYLNSLGLPPLTVPFESVSLPFAMGVLEHSDAVWFISRGVVARDLDRQVLRTFDVGGHRLSGAVGLTRRLSQEDKEPLDALAALLHARADD